MSKKLWFFVTNDCDAQIIQSDKPPKMSSEGGPWTSSCGYCETEEELHSKWDIQDDPCSCCGRLFSTKYTEPIKSEMIRDRVCFSCHFWNGYVVRSDDTKIARIEGSHYVIGDEAPSRIRGHGGRKFTIHFHDGRKVVSTNLWFQGTIPEHFRNKLPDNAVFENIPDPVGHGQGFLGGVR